VSQCLSGGGVGLVIKAPKDRQNRADRTGQAEDGQIWTSRMRLTGQDCQDKTARAGKPGEDR
jgi:hypothetical protein